LSSRGRLDVVGGSARGARDLFVEVGWRGNADDDVREGNLDDGDVGDGERTIGTGQFWIVRVVFGVVGAEWREKGEEAIRRVQGKEIERG